MVDGKVFIGGGGSEADEERLWDSLFMPGQYVVCWPYGRTESAQQWRTHHWLAEALAARGRFRLENWIDVAADHVGHLPRAEVLVVPGGSTFALLAHLQNHGWLDPVRDFVARGGRLQGG